MTPAREDITDPFVGLTGIEMLVDDLTPREPAGFRPLTEMILSGGPQKGPQFHRDEIRARLLCRGGFGTDLVIRAIALEVADDAGGIDESVEHVSR